jgi:hypothetical protein
MKDNKYCNIPHAALAPAELFLILNTGIVLEGQDKFNNTEVKYGATFYGCHTALDTCCYDA